MKSGGFSDFPSELYKIPNADRLGMKDWGDAVEKGRIIIAAQQQGRAEAQKGRETQERERSVSAAQILADQQAASSGGSRGTIDTSWGTARWRDGGSWERAAGDD